MVSAYMFIRNNKMLENICFFTLCNTNFLGVYDNFYKFLYDFWLLFSVAEISDEALICGSISGFFRV